MVLVIHPWLLLNLGCVPTMSVRNSFLIFAVFLGIYFNKGKMSLKFNYNIVKVFNNLKMTLEIQFQSFLCLLEINTAKVNLSVTDAIPNIAVLIGIYFWNG